MSAYAHQMEREFSSWTLSSRGNSVAETGSQYVEESGFYMSSFAGTILIGALVTVGILLITLLITLAVMLQSCQNGSAKSFEIQKSSDYHSYCERFFHHAELNSLEADELPPVCWSLGIQYIREGQYERDMNFTMQMIESYFHSRKPSIGTLDVVLIDIDDIFAPDFHVKHRLGQHGCNSCIDDGKQLKNAYNLRLYTSIRSKGWPLILLSRMPKSLQNFTVNRLISAGYDGWFSLMMRSDDEMQMDTREYFSRRIEDLQKQGFNIICSISPRMDALTGLYSGKRIFKLPNPVFFKFQNQIQSCI